MKICLLGDSHFGVSSSSNIYHDYFAKSYDFFFKQLKKRSVKTILSLGDLYDNRREIHFTTIAKTNEYFFDPLLKHKMNLIVMAGNHDILYKNNSTINSLDLLPKKYVTTITQNPETHIFSDGSCIDIFPWINESNIETAKELSGNPKSKYCFGHFEFANFPMYRGIMADHGMDHSQFMNYERVFSGHYHTISSKDNIRYVGTPYELTWADCDDPKGILVFDTETGEEEFIRNPFSLFEKITYIEDMDYDFSSVKDKNVKIIVSEKKVQSKLDKFIDTINQNQPHDVKVIDNIDTASIHNTIENTKVVSTRHMIENVLDEIDTNLDKTLLKQYVNSVYTEAAELTKTL